MSDPPLFDSVSVKLALIACGIYLLALTLLCLCVRFAWWMSGMILRVIEFLFEG